MRGLAHRIDADFVWFLVAFFYFILVGQRAGPLALGPRFAASILTHRHPPMPKVMLGAGAYAQQRVQLGVFRCPGTGWCPLVLWRIEHRITFSFTRSAASILYWLTEVALKELRYCRVCAARLAPCMC